MSSNYNHYSNFNMSQNDFDQEKKGEPVGFVNDLQSFQSLFDKNYSEGIHAPATDWRNTTWEIKSDKKNPYSEHYKKKNEMGRNTW